MEIFFQNLNMENFTQTISGSVIATSLVILGLVGAIVGIIVFLGAYIYFALALSAIAKKRSYARLWLAWIPIANLFLFPIFTGRK